MRKGNSRLLAQVLLIMALPAAAAAQPYVYVLGGDGVISKVETPSNTVVATLRIEGTGLAVTPDGGYLYVTNSSLNVVYAVKTATLTLGATVPVGGDPFGLAITPDGQFAYVLELNDIEVIQTDTNVVVSVLPTSYTPLAIAFSHDGSVAYITDGGPALHVLRIADNTFLTPITVSGAEFGTIAVSPAGLMLYATSFNSNIYFINSVTGAVTRTVTIPHNPLSIAVAPDSSTIYVLDFDIYHGGYGDLYGISVGGAILRHLRLGFNQEGFFALSFPDGRFAYISNNNGPAAVVDTSIFTNIGSLPPSSGLNVATQPSLDVPLFHYKPDLFFQVSYEEAVLSGTFGLGPGSTGLGLPESDLTLEMANVELTIPAKSFQKDQAGGFTFTGVVNNAKVQAAIDPVKGGYQFNFQLDDVSLKGIANPVTVRMIVGNNIGGATIHAKISQ